MKLSTIIVSIFMVFFLIASFVYSKRADYLVAVVCYIAAWLGALYLFLGIVGGRSDAR